MVAKSLFLACTAVAVSFVAAPAAARPALANTTTFLPFAWENFDLTVSPAQDFDNYISGGWKKAHPLPADKNAYSAFAESADYVKNMVKGLFDAALTSKDKSLFNEVVKSGMDVKAQDAAGIKPISDLLKVVSAAKSAKDFVDVTAALHREAVGVSFSTGAFKDPKAPINIVYMSDLGDDELGIPRDYYLNASNPIHVPYKAYMTELFKLAGDSPSKAKAAAESVWKLEGALAKASLDLDSRNDPLIVNNKMTIANMTATAGGFDFKTYLSCLGVPMKRMGPYVIVNNPAYLRTFGKMLNQKNLLDAWKSYYRVKVLSSSAPYLTQKFQAANFEFVVKTLNGQQAPTARWEQVFSFVESNIQDTIAKPFVEKAFSAKDKATVAAIFEEIRAAFTEHVKNRSWLSEATKAKAADKLSKVDTRIAYPDSWETYSEIKGVSASKPFATNRRLILSARIHLALQSIGKKPDTTRWDMSPTEVNAYYEPTKNMIVVTTGMLTPPNYYTTGQCPGLVCAAYNWGSMAAGTLGHELGHSVDSDGRQYDATGALENWWTEEDSKNFDAKAQKLIDQANGWTMLGLHVNGGASVGENTADLGGLAVGMTAMKNWMKKNGRLPDITIPGPGGKKLVMTPEQQFYAGYAISWREVRTEASIRKRIASDVHAPAHWRINGPMSNLPDFWAAYNVPAGAPEHAPESTRVEIW
ncbi:hypothetical protein HDU86_002656 [Geranomyces michiganensis]|nr:hypothetical protein HDU86_002656 [Geranomyces michiganensis]